MTFGEEVIVLNHTKIKDNLLVIHCLGRDHGRRSFMVRVGGKTSMAFLQPFSIVELSVTENARSELWFAKPLAVKEPLNGVRCNLYKNTMTLFMAELLFRTIKDGAMEEGLYDWCIRQILTLDALTSDFSNFPLLFLLGFCSALGFRPTSEDLRPFSGENHHYIEHLLTLDFASAMLLPLSGTLRNELSSAIVRYLEFHTESAINLRSLAVLREFYSE